MKSGSYFVGHSSVSCAVSAITAVLIAIPVPSSKLTPARMKQQIEAHTHTQSEREREIPSIELSRR